MTTETAQVRRVDWCRTCCTRHSDEDVCPGELLATGVERHGWRAGVEEKKTCRVYGTLVAPVGRIWRARIITYPNILWVVPGGGSMKFLGETAAEAEQAAIDHITGHCRRKGYTIRNRVPAVESQQIDSEEDGATASSPAVRASRRRLRTNRIRYGMGRLTDEAETGDLSETGLFIRTDAPYPRGADVQMHIDLDGFGVPLRGIVQWSRDKPRPGRAVGMGIRLHRPHPRYIHYLRQLSATETGLEVVDEPRD